jgi:ribosomal protein L12E/L44/L45/RPP1/RPP2
MRIRGLLVAAAVLAVLAAGVWWSNRAKKAEEGKPRPDEPPKILSLAEDQIRRIEIRKKGVEPTVLEKNQAGNWEMTAPRPLRIDRDAVSSLTSTLSSLNSDRLIEEKAEDLAPYGLNQPAVEILVTLKDGKTHKLLIGDETPTGGGFYARLDGDPRVFTIASWNKSSLDKSWQDLRDKRLLTFDQDKLLRVELTAKGQTIEFGKNAQNEWQILKPRPLRADNFQVEELIRKLRDARMDTSVSEAEAKKAAAAFAQATRVAIARVTDSSGTQELEVRKDKEKNYYARSSVVEGIHKIFSDIGDGLDKGLDDFRNKKLFDFGWSEPSRIEVRREGKTVVYQKVGDKWMSGDQAMDSPSVQALIDKLRDLSAVKFPEKGGGAPVLEITVTSNEGKRVEKVILSRQGNSWFATREKEPAVYELEASAVEQLEKTLGEVKPAPASQKQGGTQGKK